MKGLEDDEGPESSLRKLVQTFGVLGYIILNKSGIPVKSHGVEPAEAIHYAGLISELSISAKEFLEKKLFKSDDSAELLTLRLRSRKHEIVISPEENFTLIVIHNPNYVEPVQPKVPVAAAEKTQTEEA